VFEDILDSAEAFQSWAEESQQVRDEHVVGVEVSISVAGEFVELPQGVLDWEQQSSAGELFFVSGDGLGEGLVLLRASRHGGSRTQARRQRNPIKHRYVLAALLALRNAQMKSISPASGTRPAAAPSPSSRRTASRPRSP